MYNKVYYNDKTILMKLFPTGEYISDLVRSTQTFYELDHLEALNFLPVGSGIFIDAGANIGNHTLYYASVLGRQVHAFEPVRENYDLLSWNILLNDLKSQVTTHNCALGSSTILQSFYQVHENNSGTWHSFQDQDNGIATKKIDHLFQNDKIAYIKIDTEGNELPILEGAYETLKRDRPLISAEYHYGTEFKSLREFLSPLGYRLVHVFGRSNNAIFVHNSMITEPELLQITNVLTSLGNRLLPKSSSINVGSVKQNPNRISSLEKTVSNEGLLVSNKDRLLEVAEQRDSILSSRPKTADALELADLILKQIDFNNKDIVLNLSGEDIQHSNVLDFKQSKHICFNGSYITKYESDDHFFEMIIRKIIHDLKQKNSRIFILTSLENVHYGHDFKQTYDLQYGVVVSKLVDIPWQKWTYLSNASFISTSNKQLLKQFTSQYIFPVSFKPKIKISTNLFEGDQPNINQKLKAKKRVLLVSYYALDLNTVGVYRANYWFNNLPKLSNDEIHIEMVTACKPVTDIENVHYVPDYGIDSSADIDATLFIESKQVSKYVNTTALSWKGSLENYFNAGNYNYDVVIITGNPFMHFGFSEYAKLKWNAKVIQDYRDPMASNPRMSLELEPNRKIYEDRFCNMADKVITVNSWCAKVMSNLSPQPVVVIGNGYDESVFIDSTAVHKKSKSEQVALDQNANVIKLVYAGSFAKDRNPQNLITAVEKVSHYEFHHFGSKSDFFKSKNSRVVSHGKKSYDDLTKTLHEFDIGIVYCSHDFESTTKIYDYIACDMIVLVITSPENPYPENLKNELDGLDNVFWVINTESAIKSFLKSTKFKRKERLEKERFSRKYRTLKLIELIKSL